MSYLINQIQESTCKYLFRQEVTEIFKVKFSNSIDQTKFIDQCLELSIRINIFLLTHKDGFFLIDPMAFNNQCHLYALRVAQIKKNYSQKTEKEKLARTEENRFLHLSFFLTYSLINDTALFIEAAKKAIKEMEEKMIFPQKHFVVFLRDEGKQREKASRLALNEVFECYIKESLSLLKHESPLHSELLQMAHENLQMVSSRGIKSGVLYTYPKLAGVIYMVDTLAKESIAFITKVKVITKDGAAGTIMQVSGNPGKNDPVIIFEALATDGSYSVPYIREAAKQCPSYFYRYPERNKRHKENENCFFCRKTTVDLDPFRDRLQLAMKSTKDMFYALGSDFILQVQSNFKSFFENKDKYPCLNEIFQTSIPNIQKLGLEMNNPQTFSICHVHTDNAIQAFSEKLLLESSGEIFLKEREII